MNHVQSVSFTMEKLKQFKREHQEALSKTYWWKFKIIKHHKDEIDFYDDLLTKLGDNPTILDVAFIVPDTILEQMGW